MESAFVFLLFIALWGGPTAVFIMLTAWIPFRWIGAIIIGYLIIGWIVSPMLFEYILTGTLK